MMLTSNGLTRDGSGLVHHLKGLEADNLLAFLALLGLLRALESLKPEWRPRVAWYGEPPRASIHLTTPVAADEMIAATEAGVIEIGRVYDFDRADIKYTVDEFRDLAKKARKNRDRAYLVAALGSDGVVRRYNDVIEPTPFCAMFGQGHQHFLSRLEAVTTRDQATNGDDLFRALFEEWRYEDDTEGFRWDPIEDRRYAHQYGDPSQARNKVGTVTGANRLAAIGFGMLVSVPTFQGLATLGVATDRGQPLMCWPLMGVPSTLEGHLALLSHPHIGDPERSKALGAYGVLAIARALRYRTGKFFNFQRARLQRLQDG